MVRSHYWTVISFLLFSIAAFGCGKNKKKNKDRPPVVPWKDVVFEKCDNGEDDDGDGLADCKDTQCQLKDVCEFEPSDPAKKAPEISGGGIPNFHDAVEFLWKGDNPVVRGVDPEAIDPDSVSVLHGTVRDASGDPVAGARTTIPGKPEFGYTYTRSDGAFDMIANGGDDVVVRLDSSEHLPVDREIDASANDFNATPDVVLTKLDDKKTRVKLSDSPSVASGSQVQDEDGERKLRMYFPPDTKARVQLKDGREATIEKFTVRATEYTVGDRGRERMPARLPEESAYTYAVELTMDEARKVGTNRAEFTKPVVLYLDNFLDFDVGTTVPSGFYDRANLQWSSNQNGKVVARVGDGLDTDGDGAADSEETLEELGVTDAELKKIRKLYDDGDVFWRAPVVHFTPHDLNWSFDWPDGAIPPQRFPDFPETEETDPCQEAGSIIECQNRVLGKRVDIPGTEHAIAYRSDRTAASGRKMIVNVTGEQAIDRIHEIKVTISVAGESVEKTFEPKPNISFPFEWDGEDRYGRKLVGQWPVHVSITYYFAVEYTAPVQSGRAFARPSPGRRIGDGRILLGMSRTFTGRLGRVDAKRMAGMGGWAFVAQPFFDGNQEVFYPASRPERGSSDVSRVVNHFERFENTEQRLGFDFRERTGTLAGHSMPIFAGDGGVVWAAPLMSNATRSIIRRAPDGSLEHVAGKLGTGTTKVCRGSGCFTPGEAKSSWLPGHAIAMGADGEFYVASKTCISKIADGELELVFGVCGRSDDPILDDLPVDFFKVVGAGPDGEVYTSGGDAIYRVDPEKGLRPVAGHDDETPDAYEPGDGGPAEKADVEAVELLRVADDGTVYFVERGERIRRIDPSGTIDTIYNNPGDEIVRLSVASAGEVYFMTERARPDTGAIAVEIHRIGDTGRATTIAGASIDEVLQDGRDRFEEAREADGVPANFALILVHLGLAAGPDGTVYFSEQVSEGAASPQFPVVKEVRSAFPDFDAEGSIVASRDGSHIYEFDRRGRIEEVRSARTNETLYGYEYDGAGRITAIVSAGGERKTKVERNGQGRATAIVGPFGHRTKLGYDQNGYLSKIETPTGASAGFEYDSKGLLQKYTSPDGDATTYQYNEAGELKRMEGPAGGWKTLTSTAAGGVRLETSTGRTQEFSETPAAFADETSTTDAAGLTTKHLERWGQSEKIEQPDGTVIQQQFGFDPRFGLQSKHVARRSTTVPSGLEQTMRRDVHAELSDPNDLTSLKTLTETVSLGGSTWRHVYDASNNREKTTSPEGRTVTVNYDARDRPKSIKVGNFEAVEFRRDGKGRVKKTTQGNRSITRSYGGDGLLQSETYSSGLATSLKRDASGRVTRRQRGDGSGNGLTWKFGYDASDHTKSVTAGGKSVRQSFTPAGRLSKLTDPSGKSRTITWNVDDNRTSFGVPGLASDVTYEHDEAGRLTAMKAPGGVHGRSYDSGTGNIAKASSPDVTTRYEYDGFLVKRRTHEFEGLTTGVERSFDSMFRVESRKVDGGQSITRSFDRDGLLESAGQISLTWGDDAPVLEETTVGAVTSSYGYNSYGERESHAFESGGSTIYRYELSFGASGRIDGRTETVGGSQTNWAYEYDAAGRLTEVLENGSSVETYAYDARGNLTSIEGKNVTYGSGDRLKSVGNVDYTFDDAGFLESKTRGGQTTNFEFDFRGDIVRADTPSKTIRYRYDALGRRVARTVDGNLETAWVYDDVDRPVAQLDGSGNIEARFVYASRSYVPDLMMKGGTIYRFVTDHVGSVRMVVDASDGSVAQRIDYTAYGRVKNDTNPGFQPFAYAGGLRDPDTGLVRLGVRDYDPEAGRWVAPDPSGLAGGHPNLFVYGYNDPVNMVDPAGEVPWVAIVIPGAGGAYALWRVSEVKETAYSAKPEADSVLHGYGTGNGPQDALRHCTMSCKLQQEYGTEVAELAGWYHEAPEPIFHGNPFSNLPDDAERVMDEKNNACGRRVAREFPNAKCIDLCKAQLKNGELEILPEDDWYTPADRTDPARRAWKQFTGAL